MLKNNNSIIVDMPPQALWVLPNKYLDIEFEKTPYIYTTKQNRIKSISLTYEGRTYAIKKEDWYKNKMPSGNKSLLNQLFDMFKAEVAELDKDGFFNS